MRIKSFSEYINETVKWKKLGDNLKLKYSAVVFKGNHKFIIPGKTRIPVDNPIVVSAYFFKHSNGVDGKIEWNGYSKVDSYENLDEFRSIFYGN